MEKHVSVLIWAAGLVFSPELDERGSSDWTAGSVTIKKELIERTMKSSATQGLHQNHREDIAQLAYQLWESRGHPHGNDQEIWLEAESEILARETTRNSTVNRAQAEATPAVAEKPRRTRTAGATVKSAPRSTSREKTKRAKR